MSTLCLREAETTMASLVCAFCKQCIHPDVVGEMFSAEKMMVHQHCLYFSSGLAQCADGTEKGISGFHVGDIAKELRRGLAMKCYGCHKAGGYVGCAIRHCQKVGHFPCLYQLGFSFHYGGNFEAYCTKHSPTQAVLHHQQNSSNECCICLAALGIQRTTDQIYCPSCFTMFHKSCIQKQALSAGLHHFCCAVCKNRDIFCKEMVRMGMSVPDRDAAWEMDTDYVTEEAEYCHVDNCLSPQGRAYHAQIGKYRMRKCSACGQWRGHVECLRGEQDTECADCRKEPSRSLRPLGTKVPVVAITKLTAQEISSFNH